jgi:hypothetical protein
MDTPLPHDPPLATALRACADGFYPAEAVAELLICHASWLCRDDFCDGYVDVGSSIANGVPNPERRSTPEASGEYYGSRLASPTAYPSISVTRSPGWTRPTSTEPSARCSTPRDADRKAAGRPENRGIVHARNKCLS